MVRSVAVVAMLSCLASFAWAQTQPGPPATTVAKKQAQKARITAKQPTSASNAPCQIGVLPALGDRLVIQKVGITVFGNERTEVPVDWGIR